jgi:ligand-binding sensor domain-containing protein
MVSQADLPTNSIDRIACTPAQGGGLWVLLGSELRRYSRGVEISRRRLPHSVLAVRNMTEDTKGNLWICSSTEGVLQVLPDGRTEEWKEGRGLAYHGVRFAFEDLEGNVWLGTSGGGLARLKPRRFDSIGREQGLKERVVKSVWPGPDATLWIATYGGGLFQWSEKGLTNVPLPEPFPAGRYVQSVLTDRQGRTWVGTYNHGLYILDPAGGHRAPKEHTGGNNIIALFEDLVVQLPRSFSAHQSSICRGPGARRAFLY